MVGVKVEFFARANMIAVIIAAAVAGAVISAILPRKKADIFRVGIVLAICIIMILSAFGMFANKQAHYAIRGINLFMVDSFSALALGLAGLFGALVALYAAGAGGKVENSKRFWTWFVLSLGFATGSVCSDHLLVLAVFWAALGITLHKLIGVNDTAQAKAAAHKTMVIVGMTDCLLLAGAVMLHGKTGTYIMSQMPFRPVEGVFGIATLLLLASAAFAKVGVFPLHTWIPDSASSSPSAVMALMPASLDKIVGIYFLCRISLDVFNLESSLAASRIFMVLGSITLLCAVLMALVQHDIRKLLAYHSISQVGYMVLGIASGSVLGIAGALFHMINNAIYKTALFMGVGIVEKDQGTTDISQVGGMSSRMKILFGTFGIAALAIAGVPPLNGFFSKWMIYQGILEGAQKDSLWPIWLVAAMFGSALTMASFIKLAYAIFLSPPKREGKMKSLGFVAVPMVILASGCVLIGLFARALVLRPLLAKPLALLKILQSVDMKGSGTWVPLAAMAVLVTGLVIGAGIAFAAGIRRIRRVSPYVAGELMSESMETDAGAMYNTILEMKGISRLVRWSSDGSADIYVIGEKIMKLIGLEKYHVSNVMHYAFWIFLALIIMTQH